jgi:LmbE family N-acetylglucosaminyl deacetylase
MSKILAIWPHPDDIELWCFWTMCRYASDGHDVSFLVMSEWEWWTDWNSRISEAFQSSKLLKCNLFIENLKDRYISEWVETIWIIEKYIEKIKPDIVYIPSKHDTHQDHRAVHYASIVATRLVNEIYIYQSPSTNLDFRPSFYVDISKYIDIKIKAVQIHSSQWWKVYMADRAVKWLAEYRAFDIFRNDKYFEAFEIFRLIK